MTLVLTIIINYGHGSCASACGDHVQRVCWSYHYNQCLIFLHNVITQDRYGSHTDTLALYSCGRNYHLHLK